MQLKEINCIEFEDRISEGFICKWSDDNHLLILADNMIHTFQYLGIPKEVINLNVSFKQQTLKPNTYFPSMEKHFNINSIFERLPKESVYEAVLDHTISANLKMNMRRNFIFNYADWSPAGLVDRKRCVLATINNCGAVELSVYCNDRWVYIAKVTETVLEEFVKKWDAVDSDVPQKLQFPIYKKRIHEIGTSCLTWSTMYKDFCVLVLGHIGGRISFWIMNKYETFPVDYVKLRNLANIDSCDKRITALHWITIEDKAFLIYGNVKGEVTSIKLESISADNVNLGSENKIFCYQDNIKVTHIISFILNNNIYIFIVKQSFLICIKLDQNDNKAIKMKHLRLGNLQITDIQKISEDKFLVLNINGAGHFIRIENINEENFEFTSQVFDLPFNIIERSFHGIFTSPSGLYWGFISKSNSLFSLKTKDVFAIKLNIYVDESKNPEEILTKNTKKSLYKVWDCLDMINYTRCTSLKRKLFVLPEPVDIDSLSLYELKYHLWLSASFDDFISRIGSTLVDNTMPSAEFLRNIIQMKTSIKWALHVLEKLRKNPEYASNNLWISLRFIRDTSEEFRDKYKDTLKNFVSMEIDLVLMQMVSFEEIQNVDLPKCSYCDNELRSIQCQNTNHFDPRCMVSLLQICQRTRYYCPRCSQAAHEILAKEEEFLFCTFCDIPLVTNFTETFEWEREKNLEKTTEKENETSSKIDGDKNEDND